MVDRGLLERLDPQTKVVNIVSLGFRRRAAQAAQTGIDANDVDQRAARPELNEPFIG